MISFPVFVRQSLNLWLLSGENIGITTQRDGGGESGCSASSFLIGDGVCDEITNNARCLFDNRDCCRQEKITRLCQNCTCILEVDQMDLNGKLKDNQVKIYAGSESSEQKVFDDVYTVEEVASKWVCYILCLEMKPEVNSWTFTEANNNTCICSAMRGCYSNQDLITIHDYRTDIGSDLVLPYLVLSAIPICSKRFQNRLSVALSFTIHLCFAEDYCFEESSCSDVISDLSVPLYADTAEHCQEECQRNSTSD